MRKKGQLKVTKADGSREQYFHTKVMGTVSKVLDVIGHSDIYLAEQLADVVTYHLYDHDNRGKVTSSEIFSMIKVVLFETGNEDAAMAFSDNHFKRMLSRNRIEVVDIELSNPADLEKFSIAKDGLAISRWDKTHIVVYLEEKFGFNRNSARMAAGMVEEKIISLGISQVSKSLIKQLVLSETAMLLRAERQLQMA